jgi:anti-sigma factor RsiW
MCEREDLRFSIGALALGALDADEAREVRGHLADCPECQAEYTSFVGVKRIMDVGLVGAPMPELAELSKQPKHRKLRPGQSALPALPALGSRLRRRLVLGTAGALAAVALIGGGFAMGRSNDGSRATVAQSTALAAVTESGVTAQISYSGHGWGTWIDAKMSGAPAGTVCTLYVYDKNQTKVALSSWKSVGGGKQIDVPAATSLSPDQIDHFEVRVDDQGYDISVPMTS